MATVPEREDPSPTPVERIRQVASDPSIRFPVALALAAAAATFAPVPASTLAVAALVVVAVEGRRR